MSLTTKQKKIIETCSGYEIDQIEAILTPCKHPEFNLLVEVKKDSKFILSLTFKGNERVGISDLEYDHKNALEYKV